MMSGRFIEDESGIRCSFCGRSQTEAKKIIAGQGVFICAQCIELCNEMLRTESRTPVQRRQELGVIPRPKEIYEILNQYVVGQDQAKRILSVAVYNHYKRVNSGRIADDVELQKSNILLIGPTGSGKTLLAQTLAKILDVPFAIADATALTEAGYVGEDVENVLLRLVQAAHGEIEKTEKGIVYIDEVHTIARKSENPSITRDVSGEGVQQALLKILEGSVANVPPQGGRKHPLQEYIQLNTKGILFICGGSFEGLERIIESRTDNKAMGFGVTRMEKPKAILNQVMPDDLIKYGLIPEFVGRLPVVATLAALDKAALVKVLVEPKDALVKQYQKIFSLDGINLTFTEDALEAIATEALNRGMGARALRTILEEVMLDIMFEAPSEPGFHHCEITVEMVKSKSRGTILKENG